MFYAAGIDLGRVEVEVDMDRYVKSITSAPQGALKIILIDRQSGRAIWGAAAVGDVRHDRSTETVKKRLDFAVRKMFRQFPN